MCDHKMYCDHNMYCAFGARPGSVKCQGYNSTSLKPSFFPHCTGTSVKHWKNKSLLCLVHQFLVSQFGLCVDFLNVI